ncbi:sensor histidine kinase [Aquihabitans sp. McL0605]|uniref:sensor histidine kinase n=1 Tax=Aquihabitans sp. McL0605 TaxID=3415671 RepID=UPI003CEF560A
MPLFLRPWRNPERLWRSLAYLAVGVPLGIASFTVLVTLLATTVGLLVTLVLAVPAAWTVFLAGRVLGEIDRSRAVALLGIEMVDAVPPLESTNWFKRLWERVRTRSRWREIANGLLLFPVALGCWMVTTVLWAGSLALVALPLYAGHLPGGTAKFWLFELGSGAGPLGGPPGSPTSLWTWVASAVGLFGLASVAPWATLGAANLQSGISRRLLSRTSEAEMAELLRRAEGRRSAAVDSAETERRRIERDLHDGAQQRLVALAAGLGAAREKLDEDPEQAKALVADAHEEAKSALKEIRDLVRGIHPVILEDRGLDAALSAVVARSPVPVRLAVDVDPRPSPAVESAAYFIVNEALTNVARHAQATRADVAIARSGSRLVIEVRDDGVGGADASQGTGLQGLRERVDGLGGNLQVISPAGGPTTISVELPCAS